MLAPGLASRLLGEFVMERVDGRRGDGASTGPKLADDEGREKLIPGRMLFRLGALSRMEDARAEPKEMLRLPPAEEVKALFSDIRD